MYISIIFFFLPSNFERNVDVLVKTFVSAGLSLSASAVPLAEAMETNAGPCKALVLPL